jgi:hypothetical protein
LQQGERRKGQQAIQCYQSAVQHFESALRLQPTPADRVNVLVLCSEALQQWAQQILALEASLPDTDQTAAVEGAANRTAQQLYRRAVEVQLPAMCPIYNPPTIRLSFPAICHNPSTWRLIFPAMCHNPSTWRLSFPAMCHTPSTWHTASQNKIGEQMWGRCSGIDVP